MREDRTLGGRLDTGSNIGGYKSGGLSADNADKGRSYERAKVDFRLGGKSKLGAKISYS